MYLRELRIEDAPLMLEWMHDEDVVRFLYTDFSKKNMDDCYSFIKNSKINKESINLAISDDNDEYMGTVSLKHIDTIKRSAEFAITVRTCAMGKGYAREAMELMLKTGFEKYNLEFLFWCVSPDNKRAVRFYEKNGYSRIEMPEYVIGYDDAVDKMFIWYGIRKVQK